MIRKIKTEKQKVPAILRSLSLVNIALDVANIEYEQYLDHNFKSPIAHQKCKQARENIEYTINHLQRHFLTKSEETEDITFKLHYLMRLVMKLTVPEIDGLIKGIEELERE